MEPSREEASVGRALRNKTLEVGLSGEGFSGVGPSGVGPSGAWSPWACAPVNPPCKF